MEGVASLPLYLTILLYMKQAYEQEMDKHIKNEPGYIKYNLNYKAKKL